MTDATDPVGEIEEVIRLVSDFFRGNKTKTAAWLKTPNPMFGYVSPYEMIDMGRGATLLKWVRAALAENEPPKEPRP